MSFKSISVFEFDVVIVIFKQNKNKIKIKNKTNRQLACVVDGDLHCYRVAFVVEDTFEDFEYYDSGALVLPRDALDDELDSLNGELMMQLSSADERSASCEELRAAIARCEIYFFFLNADRREREREICDSIFRSANSIDCFYVDVTTAVCWRSKASFCSSSCRCCRQTRRSAGTCSRHDSQDNS